MMTVLLIRPKAPNVFRFSRLVENEPIELEYLMTALKANGHNAEIYDGIFDKRPLKRVLREVNPDVVAITGYITQENVMKKVAEKVKRYDSGIFTMVGGVHVQLCPDAFKIPEIDYIFRSADMDVFAALIDLITDCSLHAQSSSDYSSLSEINGLIYQTASPNGTKIWHTNPLSPCDIDRLPIPDRSHFYENRRRYRYLQFREVATIKTAFSCPQVCSFCYCKQLNGGLFQTRNLDKVMEELSGIDAEVIQIVDDDFLADIQRAWSFVEKVRNLGISKKYICYARADEVAAHPDLVRALQSIGFHYFIVGLEAVDDATLLDYQKRTTAEINKKCVETIHASGAECIALMMVSHTAEKCDFDAIYDWAKSHGLIYTTVSIFTPIPGTPLYEQYKHQITTKKIEHWDFLHLVLKPTKLSKAMFYYHFIRLTVRLFLLGKKRG